jgi:hypothetical protein
MLYHSFPRPRPEKWGDPASPDKNPPDKGIKILENILKYGLLLVPELLPYPGKTDAEGNESGAFNLVQCRFSLTAIEDIAKLKDHAKAFGDIHLEFTEESAYAMGVIPVMYVPKAPFSVTAEPTSLWHLAASLIHRLSDLQTIAYMLEYLDGAVTDFAHEEEITVNAETGNSKQINVAQLCNILELILEGSVDINKGKKEKKAEFKQIQGAIQALSSLFYFTDTNDELLHYFKQREWRIIQGMSIKGNEQDRKLTFEEQEAIKAVDGGFFDLKLDFEFRTGRHHRIDLCRILPAVKGKHIREYINRILVTSALYEQAIAIAKANNFPVEKIIPHNDNYAELKPDTNNPQGVKK